MPIHLFYELKNCEDISYAVPLRLKSGGRAPSSPHRSMPMLCRTSQSNILAKKSVTTHSNGNKLQKVQESATSAVGDKHQAGEGWKSNTAAQPGVAVQNVERSRTSKVSCSCQKVSGSWRRLVRRYATSSSPERRSTYAHARRTGVTSGDLRWPINFDLVPECRDWVHDPRGDSVT